MATKIAVNDASQVASAVDKLEQVIDFLSEAIDPPTKFRQFLAELKSVSSGCVDKLARTCAYNALFAQYCKRYSLSDGAPREQKRQVLARPYGDAKDALGGLEPPKTTPKKIQSETPQSSARDEGFKQPPFWQPPTRQTGEIEEEASKGSKSTALPPESSAAGAKETETERESEQTSKGNQKLTSTTTATTTTSSTSASVQATGENPEADATSKPGDLDLTIKLPTLKTIEKMWYDRQQAGWKNETVKAVALGYGLTNEQFHEVLRRAEIEPSPAKSSSSVAPSPGSALADAEVAAAMGQKITPKKVVTSQDAALRSESQELVDSITSPFKIRPSTQSTMSQGWSPATKEMLESISTEVLQGDVSKLKLLPGDAALQTPTPPKSSSSTQRSGKPEHTFTSTGEEPPTPKSRLALAASLSSCE